MARARGERDVVPAGFASVSCGLAARLKSCPSRSWRCRIVRGMGLWYPMSRKHAMLFDSAQGRLWGTRVNGLAIIDLPWDMR
jgi:hypothetical protein